MEEVQKQGHSRQKDIKFKGSHKHNTLKTLEEIRIAW